MPNQRVGALEGSRHWVAVVPSDGTNLPGGETRALYIGVAGNISVDSAQGDTAVIFVGLAAGAIYPIEATRIRSTGTTALSILAIY